MKIPTVKWSGGEQEPKGTREVLAAFDHVGQNLQGGGFDFARRVVLSVSADHDARQAGYRGEERLLRERGSGG